MKKFTYSFLLMFVLAAAVSFGANGPRKNVVNSSFYSQDFASGIPGTWQNIDNAGSGVKWTYTTVGNTDGGLPGFSGALNPVGTTAANGYVMFDSDGNYPLAGDGSLVTNLINCSTRSNVHLTFNEYFAQYSASVGDVDVSNDGSTWTTVHNADNGLGMNQTTANPNMVDVDISAYADGQDTVYVRFNYIGTGEWFWMVDDITLYEASSPLNVGITAITAPVSSCNALSTNETVTIRVKNFETSPITNIPVYYTVNGGAQVLDTVKVSINGGATYDFSFASGANLSAVNLYKIVAATTLAGDNNPVDDVDSVAIFVGSHSASAYTMDFDQLAEYVGWAFIDANLDGNSWDTSSAHPRSPLYSASYTQVVPGASADDWMISPCINFADDQTSYICTYWVRTFSGLSDANLEVVLLSSQNPASVVQIIDPVTTVSSATYQQQGVGFGIPSIGTYYIGFHVTNTANPTSLYLDDINLSGYVKTPSIAAKNVIVYPNPNSGTFSIANLKSFSGNVQVSIIDMMGRTVSEQNVNGLDKITMNLDNQAAGIYTVRISNNAQVLNKLITITK